jgi:hypothetical protein
MNVGTLYVLWFCAVDECSDVSEKLTANKSLRKSPIAGHKILKDNKLKTKAVKTPNFTRSKHTDFSETPQYEMSLIVNAERQPC